MIKKFLAFTLGEILIALTVIGVVAVLVMPQLLVGQKAAKAQAQFNTAYSLVAKALAEMDADEVSTDPANYPTRTFYPEFKKYNKYTVDCGVNNDSPNSSVCPTTSDYKTLAGTDAAKNLLDDGALILNNGMMFAIENCKGCEFGTDHNIWVVVDINGKNQRPNRLGYDLFAFQVLKDGDMLPLGAPGTDAKFSANPSSYCNYKDKKAATGGNYGGYTCAFYAATDKDYFKTIHSGY